MTTNFLFNNGGNVVDMDSMFIRRDLFSSGGVWLWGQNNYGELGDNTGTHRSSPVQTISGGINWKLIAAGEYQTAAIKTDGTLWTWGRNSYGELGDNSITTRTSPVQTIAGGTTWKQVSTNGFQTGAIKTDGTLWTWGRNDNGYLGDNTITHRSSPVQTVAGGAIWRQVAAGTSNIVAIKTDGTLWLWGYNGYGQLGDTTLVHKSSPIQTIAGGTNWKQVAAGSYHIAAIKTDGTLWTWGYNNYGQLGDTTLVHRSSPIQTIAGGTNWKQVAAGVLNIVAIKTDGTLWTWGRNDYGELGDNTLVHRSSPVQTVAGGTNWKLSAAGEYHIAAVKTDGTLWTWGRNSSGQLGDTTVVNKSSPIQTIAGGTNWKQVAEGYNFTAAGQDNS